MRLKIISILFIVLAAWPTAVRAQEKKLAIVILEGEGAFNDIRRKVGRNPVIEVHDEQGRPVYGADVIFTLPEIGASGTFSGGSKTFLTKTDVSGRATSAGLRPNATEGRFNTRVTAAAAGKSGSILISQSNTLAGGAISGQTSSRRTKKMLILIIVAGGVGGGIVAATHHGGSSGTAAILPTTLTPGPVTVGGPR